MRPRWEWKHFPAHLKLSLVYLHSDPWCCALLITARQGDFPNKAELSFQSQQVIIQLRNTSMARLWALPATFSSKAYFSVVLPALVQPQSPDQLVNSVAEMLVTFTSDAVQDGAVNISLHVWLFSASFIPFKVSKWADAQSAVRATLVIEEVKLCQMGASNCWSDHG